MATATKGYDDDLRSDVGKSYANVAASGQSKVSGVGTLQRLARAFLKWDKKADKDVRRELHRYASLSLTQENCSWGTAQSFREVFIRALISAAQNNSDPEDYLESRGANPYRNPEIRALFNEAIAEGASDGLVQHTLEAVK